MPDVASLQVVVGIDSTAAERGLDALGTKVGGVGSAIQSALGAAAVGAVVGIGAAFVGSVKSAADFEKGLSAISAVSGATKEELEGIRQTALQLGKDTSFSAAESAAGMEEMIKAGVSLADVMNGAGRAALDLAAAGGLAVPEAAALMSNAINIFKKDNLSAAESADIISQAANASAISVHDFGFSLSAVGAVAATIGFTLQDTATAIAVLGQNGLKGSDAGTSLKTMLLNLSPASKSAKSQMRELGLITADGANQFFDASGKAKDWAQIAGLLKDSLKGLTKEQQINALQTMFGTDAVRAAAIMADVGTEGVNKMAAAEKAAGTARSVAAERLNNLSGSFETFMGSVETGAIILGSMFTPALKGMADAATENVNTAIDVLEQIPDVIGTIQSVLAGDWAPDSSIHPFTNAVGQAVVMLRDTFGPSITVVGGFLQQIGEWFTATIAPIAAFVAGFLGVIGTAGLVSAAVGVIVAVLGFLLTPLGLVAVAAGLLAAAWTTNFIGIRDIVTKVLGGDLKGAFTLFVTNVTAVSQQIGTALLGWGQAFVAWVAPMIPLMLAALGKLVLDTVSWIVVQAGQFIAALLTWATAFIAWVTPIVPQLLTELGLLLLGVVGWIATVALPAIVTQLMAWATAFWGWVLPAIPPLLAALAGLSLAVGGWIVGTALPAIMTQLVTWGTAFRQWVVDATPPLLTALGALLVSLGTWVVGTALPSLVTSLVQWELAFMRWVINAGPPMLAALATLLASATAWLVGAALAAIVQSLATWATAFTTWVSPAGVAMLGEMASTMLAPMVAWITGAAASSITTGLGSWTPAFVAWAKSIWPAIQAEITAIPGRVIAALATLPTALGALGVEMIKAFIKGWLSVPIPMPSLPSFGGGGGGTPQSYTGGGPASSQSAPGGSGRMAITRGAGNSYWTSGGTHGGSPAADIFAPKGTPIYAPVGGHSSPATYPAGGNATIIKGDDGKYYYMAHGNTPFVGGRVEAGQSIGQVGDTGNARGTSPHVHYAIADSPGVFDQRNGSGNITGTPADWTPKIPLGGAPGMDPSQWPGFMQQVDEQLPAYLTSLETIRQGGVGTFGAVATGAAVSGAALVSHTVDDLGNVTQVYRDAGGNLGATVTSAAGVVTSAWGSMATGATAQSAAMSTGVGQQYDLMATKVVGSVTGMSDSLQTTLMDSSGNAVTTIVDMSGQVTAQYATLANGVSLSMGAMGTTSTATVNAMNGEITTAVTDMAGNMVTTVTTANGTLVGQYVTTGAAVVAAVTTSNEAVVANTTETGSRLLSTTTDALGLTTQKYLETNGAIVTIVTDQNRNVLADFTTSAEAIGTVTDGLGTKLVGSSTDAMGNIVRIYAESNGDMVTIVTDANGAILSDHTTTNDAVVATITDMAGNVVETYTSMGTDVTGSVEEMASAVVEQYGEIAAEAESSTAPVEDFYAAASQGLDVDFGDAIKEFEKLAKAAKKAAEAVESVGGKGGKKGGDDDDDPFGRDSGKKGDFGERAAGSDILPISALLAPTIGAGGGLPERHVIAIEIGGRIAEEIYVTGRQLAIQRGRA